ncbi:OmpA family protein [Pseudomonas moorei]|uniref:OmpA family protein n=1 Tax=Pseudomonas moorei TaxID=395599 RepID=UPI0031B9B878
MTLKLKQGLWLWAATLALVLLVTIPLAGWVRAVMALTVAYGVAVAFIRAGRRAAYQREQAKLDDQMALPPIAYRQPVVLVCGDGLAGLFGPTPAEQPALRVTDHGCYLRVSRVEQLPGLIDHVMSLRPQWCGQLSVMFVVNPGAHADAAVLAGQVRTLDYQIALIRKRGMALPLMLVSYQQASRGEGPWFSWEMGQDDCNVRESGACVSTDDWQRLSTNNAMHAERMQASVQINSAAAWLAENIVPHFTARGTRHAIGMPVICAITFVPQLHGVASSLWQRWLRDKTGLLDANAVEQAPDAPLPFPDPLLHLLPIQAQQFPMRRASVIALWLFAVAGIVALTSSAWQNRLLLREVSDDLRRYTAIAAPKRIDQPQFAEREEALNVLRQDADRLDRYYRKGEPLALGLGLYRGEVLRAQLLSTIAGHSQPSAGPKAARTVRLDSLSLFGTGSAELKPESTKVLIDALVGIKAQPGWAISPPAVLLCRVLVPTSRLRTMTPKPGASRIVGWIFVSFPKPMPARFLHWLRSRNALRG